MLRLLLALGLLSLLLAAAPGHAQRSSMSSHEEVTDGGGYKFWVRADRVSRGTLVEIFGAVSGTTLPQEFRGRFERVLDDGIRLVLNTKKRKLVVHYAGSDAKLLERTRDIARTIRLHLGQPSPPEADPPQPPRATVKKTGSTSTRSVTDDSEGNYRYWFEGAKGQEAALVATFYDATGQTGPADFRGIREERLPDGIVVNLDTDRRRLGLQYTGDDPATRETAERLSRRMNDRLCNPRRQ